jgi:hypothetical protein
LTTIINMRTIPATSTKHWLRRSQRAAGSDNKTRHQGRRTELQIMTEHAETAQLLTGREYQEAPQANAQEEAQEDAQAHALAASRRQVISALPSS